MIVGNGLLANTFHHYQDNDDIIIFAAGVSNSNETRVQAFEREMQLLNRVIRSDKLLIYFSSCDVIDENYIAEKLYYQHKMNVERFIEKNSNKYLIFRLPQVFGPSNNKHTLINYFFDKIQKEETFDLYVNHRKSIISLDDIFNICDSIIADSQYTNSIINVLNTNYVTALKVVELIEALLNKKAKYNVINDLRSIKYDDKIVSEVANKLNIIFDDSYLINLFTKYLSNEHIFE